MNEPVHAGNCVRCGGVTYAGMTHLCTTVAKPAAPSGVPPANEATLECERCGQTANQGSLSSAGLLCDSCRFAERCPLCRNIGWYLEYSGGGSSEPLTLELLPCIHPECGEGGKRIEHLSVNEVGFNRVSQIGGNVMAVGRG